MSSQTVPYADEETYGIAHRVHTVDYDWLTEMYHCDNPRCNCHVVEFSAWCDTLDIDPDDAPMYVMISGDHTLWVRTSVTSDCIDYAPIGGVGEHDNRPRVLRVVRGSEWRI